MTKENPREIKTSGGGTFRLTEEAWQQQGPTPEMQERLRRDLERREAEKQAEKERQAEELEEQENAKFYEALAERYQNRLDFYRRRGVPQSVFEATIWPKLARQYTVGEEDAVDRERRERSTSAY